MVFPMSDASADRILFLLKTRGPQTAAALAKILRVTAVAVRQQLMKLQSESLVEHRDARLTVGRPKRHWRLTEKAQARFPDAHASMTLEILSAARKVFGEAGIERLISARESETKDSYAQRLRSARSLVQKVERLAEARAAEGYMAECRTDSDGTLWLIENHCPVCAAARECQGFCRSELAIFQSLLPNATVERTDHILAGARRCAYRIVPRAAAKGAA
jgi:predicted ArsR family transcriptional regulator